MKGGMKGGMRDQMHICQIRARELYVGATLSNSDEGLFRVIDTVFHKPCCYNLLIIAYLPRVRMSPLFFRVRGC